MLLNAIWHKICRHLQQKSITKLLAIDQLYTATVQDFKIKKKSRPLFTIFLSQKCLFQDSRFSFTCKMSSTWCGHSNASQQNSQQLLSVSQVKLAAYFIRKYFGEHTQSSSYVLRFCLKYSKKFCARRCTKLRDEIFCSSNITAVLCSY